MSRHAPQKKAEREEKVVVIRVSLPWSKPFICVSIGEVFLSRSS